MSRRPLQLFFAIMAVSAMSIPLWAKPKPSSSETIKATIEVSSSTALGSMTLAPGEYHVTATGNQVKFERDGKIVAEVPCTMKDLSSKAQQTEISVDHDRLTEIQVSGKTKAIEFGS